MTCCASATKRSWVSYWPWVALQRGVGGDRECHGAALFVVCESDLVVAGRDHAALEAAEVLVAVNAGYRVVAVVPGQPVQPGLRRGQR